MRKRNTLLALSHKHYDPTLVETPTYTLWEENSVFTPDLNSDKPPYSIVIPPPNVTGRLHMGHALNNSIQDALIRFKQMDGFEALWIPGTDHAGISTQSVVKKHLDAEGINYLELGREKMIERIWEWKKTYGDQILRQLRSLGCACDWTRTRFTMDEGLSRAVRTAFKRLYDEGLIYRGKYIVNWCPVDRSALSDDEVITAEGGEPGHLWHIRYPLSDGSQKLTIATTRPETMLGDTAVAVNPKDERYQSLIGKTITLPLVGREIPIIADDYVDREFGSGCLKVTPAHDVNDFQIGLRHELLQVNVMNEDGTIGDQAPERYHGMDRFDCRDKIVEELREQGLLEKIEDRMTPLGRAQRSRAIIEYRLSDQWFVKMRPLAKEALQASNQGDIELVPERWEKVYRDWLENTRDWCISRQIWWGHRIPAWYHKETGEIAVDVDTPEDVKKNPDAWRQEDDVLDTWFSSALWPYSTMGWPDKTEDLKRFYPTSVLSTAKDIIYFWVARMVMTGTHFMGEVPFREVYFHPVICDANGETMSKSKGNGIDPLHVIAGASVQDLEGPIREARPEAMEAMLEQLHKSYPEGFSGVGADALRFTLLSLNSHAQQVQLSLQKFEEIGKRFVDKLWNASRFAISNLDSIPEASVGESQLALEDLWILGKLDTSTASVRKSLDSFRFSDAISTLYRFFWDDFCDWYVELVKNRLREGSPAEQRRVQKTLGEVLSSVLRLLHPFTPFITEELWGHLHPILVNNKLLDKDDEALESAELIAFASYPRDKSRTNIEVEQSVALLQEVSRTVRNMRSSAGLGPGAPLAMLYRTEDKEISGLFEKQRSFLIRGAMLKSCEATTAKPEKMGTAVVKGIEIFVNLAEHMDIDAEITRNKSALGKIEKDIEMFERKLGNESFLKKAPQAVQDEQKHKLSAAKDKRSKILETLDELSQLA